MVATALVLARPVLVLVTLTIAAGNQRQRSQPSRVTRDADSISGGFMSGKKHCFVIGPIGDEGTDERSHANWLFDGIIKPVFAEHFCDQFEVPVRADQIVAPGSINTQVIKRLFEVPLVIADLSLHNANAFYELAIRHMVRLPTIHIIHEGSKLPFDVAAFRAI